MVDTLRVRYNLLLTMFLLHNFIDSLSKNVIHPKEHPQWYDPPARRIHLKSVVSKTERNKI